MTTKKVVLALTSSASTVAAKQERVLLFFKAKGIDDVVIVDASSDRERRIELIAISGLGPVYPQFFIQEETGDDGPPTITFLGGFDDMVAMNDDGLITKQALGLDVVVPKQKADNDLKQEGMGGSSQDNSNRHNNYDAPWQSQPEDNVVCWVMLPDWFTNLFKKPAAVSYATSV